MLRIISFHLPFNFGRRQRKNIVVNYPGLKTEKGGQRKARKKLTLNIPTLIKKHIKSRKILRRVSSLSKNVTIIIFMEFNVGLYFYWNDGRRKERTWFSSDVSRFLPSPRMTLVLHTIFAQHFVKSDRQQQRHWQFCDFLCCERCFSFFFQEISVRARKAKKYREPNCSRKRNIMQISRGYFHCLSLIEVFCFAFMLACFPLHNAQ